MTTPTTMAILSRYSTSAVSDALDKLGVNGQALGIKPLSRDFRLVGRAFTGLYQPVGVGGGTVGDYIDDVPPGSVVVLDNGGRQDATVWGDILTAVAHRRGVAGTVIDGVCRDSDRALEVGYPIFSRGTTMRTGKDRVMLAAVDVPVSVSGVLVHPGDVLLGDADGIVVVPSAVEFEVIETVRRIEEAEDVIRRAVQAGEPLSEARRKVSYHSLQSRTTEVPS
ncbi:RraA family protein [Nocardiopsis sp. ATB16-24]|uniref:RraA family protein n=1 Tax=Nocardiopsis sp. ATB16-24 TaxID=3019555 RepID=UPI002556D28A|nr:RraA family protein [Nocardiopsis sp. ATB16-24]